jgi:class 3 adenylate cyclase
MSFYIVSTTGIPGLKSLRASQPQMVLDRANRTFICSVLFLDIVEYSKRQVSEQLQIKDQFNMLVAQAIREISPNDRIILDTGDGVAISFLGDPEDALYVAMGLRDSLSPNRDDLPKVPVRIGINLGPVRLVKDLNGQPNIIGDGINVAQRVMSFGEPSQILVSRSYHDVVSRISPGYGELFNYQGSRTDKHVREHEIYEVGFRVPRVALTRSGSHRVPDIPVLNEFRSLFSQWQRNLKNATGAVLRNRALAYCAAMLSVSVLGFAVAQTFSRPASEGSTQQRPEPAPVIVAVAPPEPAPPPTLDQRAENQVRNATAPRAVPSPQSSAPATPERAPNPTPAQLSSAPLGGQSGLESKLPHDTMAMLEDRSTPTTVEATAVIALAVAPWGEIYVDGERKGVSPPVNEVEVAPGKRHIEIRNGNFPVYSEVVDAKADQKVKIKHKFKQD